jgi:hypothetical protein
MPFAGRHSLRSGAVAALTLKHIQQRDNRWCIVDLVGKHGHAKAVRLQPGQQPRANFAN